MPEKRYADKVDITIRVPKELRNRARALVQAIEEKRIAVPGTDDQVKPSIAVLALRGLEAEVSKWEKRAKS